jgi:hypothetical protein
MTFDTDSDTNGAEPGRTATDTARRGPLLFPGNAHCDELW